MKRLLSLVLALGLSFAFALHDSAHAGPLQDHACAVCSTQGGSEAPPAGPSLGIRVLCESAVPVPAALPTSAPELPLAGARAPPR